MDADQGEMAISNADIFRVIGFELRQHGRKDCTARSLEIPVFDDRNFGIFRPMNPICFAYWWGKRLFCGTRSWLSADNRAVDFSLAGGLVICRGGRDHWEGGQFRAGCDST